MPQFVLLLHDAGNFDPNMSPDQMQAIIQVVLQIAPYRRVSVPYENALTYLHHLYFLCLDDLVDRRPTLNSQMIMIVRHILNEAAILSFLDDRADTVEQAPQICTVA